MRATFKILFYIKRGNEKHEECPIMGRLTINGTIAQFSCKCTVPESLWDAKGNCAIGKSRKAKEVNQTLDELRMQLIRHYQRLLEHSGFVTAEMVRTPFKASAAATTRCSVSSTRRTSCSSRVAAKTKPTAHTKSSCEDATMWLIFCALDIGAKTSSSAN